MEMKIDFSKIKELRKESGLTQAQLAEESDVGIVTISRLESGALNEAKAGTLIKISKVLGCTVNDIVEIL